MRYIVLFLFLSLPFACKDTFLDKQPYGAVTEELLSSSVKGCESLLIAAYSSLDGFAGWDNGNPWGSAASNWLWGSVTGGDAYKGSEANDQGSISFVETHQLNANDPYLEAKWKTLYDAIFRCNVAIRAFQQLPGHEQLRTLRIGEARFLRAHYHFEAKKMWNRVPYIDDAVEDPRVPNDRDIWPDIEADLRAAAGVLPEQQSEIGRASKFTALALLGKAYLFQKKHQEASAAFDQVISSGRYSLTPSYHDNFNPATRNNSEGVFVVQQAVNEGTEGDNGNIGDVLNYPHSGGPGGCCGFHQPSQNLVNAFRTDANGLPLLDTYNDQDVKNDQGVSSLDPFTPSTESLDPRLDWTVGRRGIPYLDWGNHPGASWIRAQSYGGPYSPKKTVYYKSQEGTLTSASGWTKGYTVNNIKLIRYADVLLMAAECAVELNQLEKARQYVNLVRARAANPAGFVLRSTGVPAANYTIGLYEVPWTDQAYSRKAVRFERRIELGMEGHRFFDLVRWGIAAEEKNAYFQVESKKRTYLNSGSFKAGKNEYYPIPLRYIVLSTLNGKETLVQNPGY
jgi:starch-binding outer membrane protein, SusD/RagB family